MRQLEHSTRCETFFESFRFGQSLHLAKKSRAFKNVLCCRQAVDTGLLQTDANVVCMSTSCIVDDEHNKYAKNSSNLKDGACA